MLKKKLTPILFGLLLLVFFVWFQTSLYPQISHLRQRIELLFYDFRLTATLPKKTNKDKRVVIVDIDEASLRAEGRWPWPRNRLAQLTTNLFDAGAIVVAYDVMFSEKERNSAIEVHQELQKTGIVHPEVQKALKKISPVFDHDRIFADALKQGDSILGYIFHRQDVTSSGVLPEALNIGDIREFANTSFVTMSSYTGNVASLQKAARSSGFFSLDADPDGILRRAPLIIRFQDKIFPSLALEAARIYYLLDKLQIQTEQVGKSKVVSGVNLGSKKFIPTDGEGRVTIPYRGPFNTYQYISAHKVLSKDVPNDIFENTIVLVGATAEGLFDLRAVPMQSVFPGVEIHANIITALLDNTFPVEPAWARGANLVLLLLTGFFLAIFLPFFHAAYQLLISVGISSIFLVFNVWMWASQGIVLSLAIPMLLMMMLAMFNLAYGFFTETEGRNKLKQMFGQYVPPELVDIMNESQDSYGFDGETREMTVLFSDICGFTTISEKLSATELKTLLNRFFTPMTKTIFDHQGTIDKYVGDMIMAFWGAPVKTENHALSAVNASFGMLDVVRKLKKEFTENGLPEISIGIGINTGQMNVGDMGSIYRRAYTVLGDSVNLASRLEGLTRYYDVDLVVGEETYEQIKDTYECRELDLVKVKGKTRPVHVYHPIALKDKLSDANLLTLRRYHDALDLYRNQDWGGARELFNRLQQKAPSSTLYQIYLERIEWYQANPVDKDWDGAFERRSK